MEQDMKLKEIMTAIHQRRDRENLSPEALNILETAIHNPKMLYNIPQKVLLEIGILELSTAALENSQSNASTCNAISDIDPIFTDDNDFF
jgi:hypothetical protein